MRKLTPIILILVSIAGFFMFIDPEFKEVKDLQKTIDENDRMLELANELRGKREDLRARFNDISEGEREILEKILPDTVDNVRLILDINNIADDVGIAITNIGVEAQTAETGSTKIIDKTSQSGGGFGTITLSFSVSATYDVFKIFMQRLEDSLRLVDIVDFSVSAGESSNFYGYNVTLNTYWLR